MTEPLKSHLCYSSDALSKMSKVHVESQFTGALKDTKALIKHQSMDVYISVIDISL